ncbi:MAG: hypothetical protein ACKVX9_07325 [Blastocatellia bacterium]
MGIVKKRERKRLHRKAWAAALAVCLTALILAGVSLPPGDASMPAVLEESMMAGLIGGGPWCAFGTGLALGLGIAGSLAVIGGATAPIGAGLSIAGAVVGGITYLGC